MSVTSNFTSPTIRIRSSHHANNRLNRPRPGADDHFEVFTSADGFCVYVRPDVLKFIADHARRNEKKETIGLLCGRICVDPAKGPYTLVMAAGDARQGEFRSSEGDVQLLASGHAKVRRRLIAANPDREVIGWYHTHPNYPPRFSSVDFREQQTWSDGNHIGIVFSGDSLDEQFGVYRGPNGTLLRPTRLVIDPDPIEVPVPSSAPSYQAGLQLKSPFLAPQREPREIPSTDTNPAVGFRRALADPRVTSIALCAALAIFGGIGFLRTWRAISSMGSRLDDIAAAKGTSVTSDKPGATPETVARPSSTAPTQTGSSISSGDSSYEDRRLDEIDLRPPAKPLLSERPRPRQRNVVRAQTKADKKSKNNTGGGKPARITAPGEQILPDSKRSPQASPKPQ